MLLKLSGFRLDQQRLPDGTAKAKVLRAVDRSKDALALKPALRLVRLSPGPVSRLEASQKQCELDDRSSCPRSHPTQLTPAEVGTDQGNGYRFGVSAYAHSNSVPLCPKNRQGLCVGDDLGEARPAASVATTASPCVSRKAQDRNPATYPNEYWHIDLTVIRLLDDTKCNLHAVIDNFSRRILSWRLRNRLAPTTTSEILKEAGKNFRPDADRRRRLRRRKREYRSRTTDGRRRSSAVCLPRWRSASATP